MTEIKHGTTGGYRKGCRLECCTAVKRAEYAKRAAMKRTADEAAHKAAVGAVADGGTVSAAVSAEVAPYVKDSPSLCAVAVALAGEIDAGHRVNGIAGASKQLAATLEAIRAQSKTESKSGAIIGKWSRPVLTVVPTEVRHAP